MQCYYNLLGESTAVSSVTQIVVGVVNVDT